MSLSEQGIQLNRYFVVPRVLIFLTSDGDVLLIKGAPHKRLWANLYNGLGGHVEKGENMLGAAERELFEEAGLSGIPLWLCGVILVDAGQESGVCVFVLRGETPKKQISPSSEGSPEWIPIEKFALLPLVEDLPVLLPRVLSMQPGDAPFSAHYQALPGEKVIITFHDA
jgi:8-oxo-dGTP diphosphatase